MHWTKIKRWNAKTFHCHFYRWCQLQRQKQCLCDCWIACMNCLKEVYGFNGLKLKFEAKTLISWRTCILIWFMKYSCLRLKNSIKLKTFKRSPKNYLVWKEKKEVVPMKTSCRIEELLINININLPLISCGDWVPIPLKNSEIPNECHKLQENVKTFGKVLVCFLLKVEKL